MKLIRAMAAGKIFGVTGNTIRTWDRLGKLKPDFVGPSGHRFYSEERLMRIVKSGRLPTREDKDDDPRAAA